VGRWFFSRVLVSRRPFCPYFFVFFHRSDEISRSHMTCIDSCKSVQYTSRFLLHVHVHVFLGSVCHSQVSKYPPPLTHFYLFIHSLEQYVVSKRLQFNFTAKMIGKRRFESAGLENPVNSVPQQEYLGGETTHQKSILLTQESCYLKVGIV
jgi:hypothetical protein